MRTLLTIIFSALLLVGETAAPVSAQPRSSGETWSVEVEGGFSSLKTGSFRDAYLQTLTRNRQLLIDRFGESEPPNDLSDVRPQTDFPTHVATGASVLRAVGPPSLKVGLSVRHTRTNAYARYADPNGSTGVDAALRTTFLYLTGRYAFRNAVSRSLTPYLQLDAGLARVVTELSERTAVQRFAGVFESDRSDAGTGWTPVVAAHVGATYPLGPVYLTARGGYRLGRAKDMLIRAPDESWWAFYPLIRSDVNISGWTAVLGVGYSF